MKSEDLRRLRLAGALIVLILIAGGIALAVSGSSPNRMGAKRTPLDGAQLAPAKPAPMLALKNYNGGIVNIARFKGKPVLVTFLYTDCPDVCPLIASNLRAALGLMSPRVRRAVKIIAVSVDPKGDTPAAVATFLRRHGMTGRMFYLVGTASELSRTWKNWGVGSERDVDQPQFVNHSGLVYGVDASGILTSIYAANFQPREIAHDVPLLAAP